MGDRLTFSGAVLDRAPSKRRDPDWVGLRERGDAQALVMSERGLWVEDGRLLLVAPGADAVFLGLSGDRPLFAMDAEARAGSGHPAGLREAASELPAEQAALGAYAASLLAWHRRHRFCANCGARPSRSTAGTSAAAPPATRTTSRAPTRS